MILIINSIDVGHHLKMVGFLRQSLVVRVCLCTSLIGGGALPFTQEDVPLVVIAVHRYVLLILLLDVC